MRESVSCIEKFCGGAPIHHLTMRNVASRLPEQDPVAVADRLPPHHVLRIDLVDQASAGAAFDLLVAAHNIEEFACGVAKIEPRQKRPQTKLPKAWDYMPQDGKGMQATWDKFQDFGGLKLATIAPGMAKSGPLTRRSTACST